MNILDQLILSIISGILTIMVISLAREIWWVLSGLFLKVFRDLISVSGDNWTAQYEEVDSEGNRQTVIEEVKLRQFGRLVNGSGTGKALGERNFKFRGHLRRNILIGTYHIPGNRKTTGSGSFQLRVEGNEQKMTGWCMWHDADTDKVEASTYEWTRPE